LLGSNGLRHVLHHSRLISVGTA